MQSRRREEQKHATVSPALKLRAQHRLEEGPDTQRRTHRDGSDRSPAQQRNLSPQKLDGVRRAVVMNKANDDDPHERRDNNWQSRGRRSIRLRSRSPPIEQVRKRPHYDEVVRHRSNSPPAVVLPPRYEVSETMEYNVEDENLDAKRVYGYEHGKSRINREKQFIESRPDSVRGMLDHKLMINENEVRGSYRIIPDTGLSSQYKETSGQLPVLPRSVGVTRLEHERLQHRELLPSDKLPLTESYKGPEKAAVHARDVSYSTVSSSYSKDHASTSQLRDHRSSSLGMSRSDIPSSHHDGIHLATSYEQSRNTGKLTEPVGFGGYGQKQFIEITKDPGTGQRTIAYQCRAYSPTMAEHEEYLNSKLQVTAQDERGYPYDDDYPRRIAPHGRLDYEQALIEYDNRELSRPSIMHPALDRIDKGEDSYSNQRRGTIQLQEHPAIQKQKYYDYPNMSRTVVMSKQGEDYLGPGYPQIGKRMSQDYEVSYMAASESDRLPILRSDYESQRGNGGLGLQQERFQTALFKHNPEIHRHAVRVQELKPDLGVHNHIERVSQRKYNTDEEIRVHGSRTINPSKRVVPEEFQDIYDTEEWIDEDEMNILYSSGNVGYDNEIYRKNKREYNEENIEEDFPSDDWLAMQDSLRHTQHHSVRFRSYSGQNLKGHPKSNSSGWYKSQQFHKRSAFHKPSKVWKQYHGYNENVHTNNDESSEDWLIARESEPSEESEEFKQMVNEAFLMYSKRLNLNSYVQRRYKEQGRAGSLYCIACGRSTSKEFMDTQRLVTHAFMSHKAGLRAKHLGLHKAICVLLGWDTVVPQETITWVPQVLPNAEAFAQKEDLILWPPLVIIHNVTMSGDNPQEWKVVSMEKIEAFLRGKGFVRRRIKLCLGKPADQSIILVKFLDTFLGLGDAGRLHKYLSDSKRGRVDFDRIRSNNSQSHGTGETGIHEDNLEHILYGYMGIAEDLDKLDFNSKKWTMIKSKKEIEDLDNAPVKQTQ
ncbi:hypothetical protein L6164_006837 [Bauhinia variegata]|uniref:Uncharacterized protein n=1 Tax=Bauhinia variegata TaxID=167791 RepID=A0ACB9PVP1_BAUVA|nr:hypothetical protein L6164_006837 [Bauhinia variegata]